MRTIQWFLFIAAIVSATTTSGPVRAAQDAQVIDDLATVYDAPSESSKEIDYLPKGTVVRISAENLQGWYKVAVPGRKPVLIGWINRKSLSLNALKSELVAAGIQGYSSVTPEPSRNRFVVTALARAIYLNPEELQTLTGTASGSQLGLGYGIELGYRLSTQWTVGAHLVSQSIAQESGSDQYTLSLGALGAFVEWTFAHTLPFKAGVSLGFGTASSSVSGEAGGTTFEVDSGVSPLWIPAKFTFQWYPLGNLALTFAAGFQYVTSSDTFAIDSSTDVEVGASVPFAEAGLQVEF